MAGDETRVTKQLSNLPQCTNYYLLLPQRRRRVTAIWLCACVCSLIIVEATLFHFPSNPSLASQTLTVGGGSGLLLYSDLYSTHRRV